MGLDGRLMAAEVTLRNDAVTVGKISSLFGTLPIASGYPYDVSADDRWFLTTIPPDGATSADLTMAQNWAAALTRH